MEIETMMRYKLPVIIVIVNNNGIYSGFSQEVMDDIQAGGDIAQWYVSLNRTTLCGMPPPPPSLNCTTLCGVAPRSPTRSDRRHCKGRETSVDGGSSSSPCQAVDVDRLIMFS